jgi:uncharacterized protein YtpQ (UPF0354 family)
MPTTRPEHQQQVLDQTAFAQHLQQHISAKTHVHAVRDTDDTLILYLHGAPVRLNLAHLYSDYRQDPTQLASIAERLVQAVRTYRSDHLVTDFASLRSHVYPMLKPIDLLVAVREDNLPMLVYRLFPAELIITYVIQERDSVAYINEQHLKTWQIDAQTLHSQALANLRERTARLAPTTIGDGPQRLLLFNTQDGYDASRILLTDMLTDWQQQLPGQLVLGIPNRDFLVALSDYDRLTLDRVARQVQIDTMQHPAGLTDQLFTLRNGEVCPASWE